MEKLLKTYFNTGDYPTGEQFAALIDFIAQARNYALIANAEAPNLYDPANGSQAFVINNADGALVASPNFGITGKIYVLPGIDIAMEGNDPLRLDVHAYEEDGTWVQRLIGVTQGSAKVFSVPLSAAYLIATIYQDGNTQYFTSFTAKPYIDASASLPVVQIGTKFYIEDDAKPLLPNVIEAADIETNLFDGTTIEDFYINTSTGVLTALADWTVTPQLPVVGGATYIIVGNKARFDASQYDAGGNWLGVAAETTLGNGNLQIVLAANCSYIQCNIAQTVADRDVVNTLEINGLSPGGFRIKSDFLPPLPSNFDQDLNTTDNVEFNSLSVGAISFDVTEWDETGTAPIPVGQAYVLPNGTLKIRLS